MVGVIVVVCGALLGWWLSEPAYSPVIRRKRYMLSPISIMRAMRGDR